MKLLELPRTPTEMIHRLLQPILSMEKVNGESGQGVKTSWRQISAKLTAWKKVPQELEDDGVEPLGPGVLARAEVVAEALSAACVEPPDTFVPNGDGGLVLRWRVGQRAWWIELDGDGSMEACLMHNGKLVWRHAIHEDPLESE
jgi:hypothetical protein